MPSPPLQRIWEPRETAVLFLWRFVFHLIRLRSVRLSKRCLRSNLKFKPCFYVSFIFYFEDLFSLLLWRTNRAVSYRILDLVVQWTKFYRVRQGMVRIFLVAFYLHKFIESAFCAWLDQWWIIVSIVFSPAEEHCTLSVSFFCFPTHNFRWKRSSWKTLWSLLAVFSLLEFNTDDLPTLVLLSYGKSELVPGSMW